MATAKNPNRSIEGESFMTHQSLLDDSAEHSHDNHAMSKPTFVDVTAASKTQPGVIKLYWPDQVCLDAMTDTTRELCTLIRKWGFLPNISSVVHAHQLGELDPILVSGLPFLVRDGLPKTLSVRQLDAIYAEFDVAHRYPGEIIAKPIALDNGAKSYELTADRIVYPRAPFTECTDYTEVSQHFHDKGNLRLTLRMGEQEGQPTVETTKQVWTHGATILGGMNAQLTKVTFV